MASYFVPRGRLLIKAGNLRKVHQKFQQQTPQPASGRWPIIKHFRLSFSQKVHTKANDSKLENLIKPNNVLQTTSESAQDHKKKRFGALRRWTGFLLKFVPVGICVYGVLDWRIQSNKCKLEQTSYTATQFQTKFYCSMPLRLISRAWGRIAACHIPENMRPLVYGWYSKMFNVNIDEALYADLKHYKSISEFFTRPLKDDVRPIDPIAPLVAPADGRVLHFGTVAKSRVEQVKGVNYCINDFLGPVTWKGKDNQNKDFAKAIKHKTDGTTTLYQCVIYLAPGDYHRFHSPTEWEPMLRRHFKGNLLSVSPKIATWLPGLFCLNERAVYMGNWQHGFFSYTAVGATNVGSMQIIIDEQLKTNKWHGFNNNRMYDEYIFPKTPNLQKGDLFGQFNMGSTIVLLFEAPSNFQFNINIGQIIKVGEALGYMA